MSLNPVSSQSLTVLFIYLATARTRWHCGPQPHTARVALSLRLPHTLVLSSTRAARRPRSTRAQGDPPCCCSASPRFAGRGLALTQLMSHLWGVGGRSEGGAGQDDGYKLRAAGVEACQRRCGDTSGEMRRAEGAAEGRTRTGWQSRGRTCAWPAPAGSRARRGLFARGLRNKPLADAEQRLGCSSAPSRLHLGC